MIVSISKLGKITKGAYIPGDPIKASNVLAIQFLKSGELLEYRGISLEEKKGEEYYLYYKDQSGKPGLFLSWRISSDDVKKLKKAIDENDVEAIKKFEDNKIRWRARMRILGDFEPAIKDKWLQQIIKSYAENLDKICIDMKKKITTAIEKTPELLVTIKIIEDDKGYYPGDYEEFANLLDKYNRGE